MHSLISTLTIGIAGLLACTLGACSNGGDEGLLITKNVATEGACTFTGASTEQFLPHGSVDPNSQDYLLHPQFQSRITIDPALASDPGTIAQRTVIVTDADIDISFPGSTLFSAAELSTMQTMGLTKFKGLLSAPVPPGGTADAELIAIHRPLIDAILAKNPTSDVEILISLVASGTMSGDTITSQRFDYPVTLTKLANVVGACPIPAASLTMPGNPCNPFQDQMVTCCTNGSGAVECPATTM